MQVVGEVLVGSLGDLIFESWTVFGWSFPLYALAPTLDRPSAGFSVLCTINRLG
jgi:hypothetical protein